MINVLKVPKIELHCHIDGSLRPETIIDIAKKEGLYIKSNDVAEIKNLVTAPIDCESLVDYLRRFDLPINVMQSKEALRRVTFELYEDAAKENVKYMEVRFAPLFHIKKGLTVEEVIESVIRGIRDAEEKYDIKGNLILSAMRFFNVDVVKEVAYRGSKFLGKGVVAIDLAGAEDDGFCNRYVEAIKFARDLGYRVTIHAGEQGSYQNVIDAVELLGAERIGHGVHIKSDEYAYNLVKEKGITLEMCPTSNVQTKAVNTFEDHPAHDFLKDGIKVTLNTDNRTVSDTTMTQEISVTDATFAFSDEEYRSIYLNSVEASFADDEVKEWLRSLI